MLFEWVETSDQQTTSMEVSELSDIDAGVGNYIAKSLSLYKTVSKNHRDKGAAEFFNRPPNEQLFIGEYEEPKRFLRALMGSSNSRLSDPSKGAVNAIKERINKRTLPVVYFYRNRGLRPLDRSIDINQKSAFQNDAVDVDVFNIEVDYTLFILAFDAPTLDRISNALMSTFGLDDVTFQSKTVVANESFMLDAKIADAGLISFDDASMSSAESRLLAHTATLTIRTEMVRVHHVARKEVTYRMQELQVMR